MSKVVLAVLVGLLFMPLHSRAEPLLPPNVSAAVKTAYLERYVPADTDKAFAITKDGQHFSYAYSQRTQTRAIRKASWRCLTDYGVPCLVAMLNDKDFLHEYKRAEEESAKLISTLPAEIPDKSYAWEHTKTSISAPAALRDGSVIHSPTPMSAPTGANVISTQELVKLYRTEPELVVLDSLTGDNPLKETLPKALWQNGAGRSQSGKNDMIEANLAKVMTALVPMKDVPIVSYCLNYECWLSWNVAMRLVAMGYTRVYWYRGGIEAWKDAGLPIVKMPLTAQLW